MSVGGLFPWLCPESHRDRSKRSRMGVSDEEHGEEAVGSAGRGAGRGVARPPGAPQGLAETLREIQAQLTLFF